MNTSRKWLVRIFLLIVVAAALAACSGIKEQTSVQEAIEAVPGVDRSFYRERQVMAEVETINDDPGRLFHLYLFDRGTGQLRIAVTCKSRPLSSTESLEPNQIWSSGSLSWGMSAPLEGGVQAYTTEAMGRDGTYGDPVGFRMCVTPEGHYIDFPEHADYIVSSVPYTFPSPETRVDSEQYARQLLAEKAVAEGKCIDYNLNVIPCEGR